MYFFTHFPNRHRRPREALTGTGAEPPASAPPVPATAGGPGPGTGSPDGQEPAAEGVPLTPAQAFDALYAYAAPSLVRQAYLLTGRRALSQESVERAFHHAWERWPEVAVDRDPVGWVRAAAHEYAMSPWHRLRGHRIRVPAGRHGGPAAPALQDALLELPPAHRRTLLLYDGLGLDLPETAAETEASTPTTARRLLHARETLAERLPELGGDTEAVAGRLGVLAETVVPPAIAPARAVRRGGERRARVRTRAAVAFTALIVGATGFTVATAPTRYHAPEAPAQPVEGVPVAGGPPALSKEDLVLRERLRAAPFTGPHRLVPTAH